MSILDEEKTDTMDSLLEPYREHECIPTGVIRPLLKCVFPSSTVVHVYSPTHYLVLAPIRDIMGGADGTLGKQSSRGPAALRGHCALPGGLQKTGRRDAVCQFQQ